MKIALIEQVDECNNQCLDFVETEPFLTDEKETEIDHFVLFQVIDVH